MRQAMRDRILAAAVSVMRERGVTNTTTKEIARVAGVAEGSIYNHFANKTELVAASMAEVAGGIRDALAACTGRVGASTVEANLAELAEAEIDLLHRPAPDHRPGPGRPRPARLAAPRRPARGLPRVPAPGHRPGPARRAGPPRRPGGARRVARGSEPARRARGGRRTGVAGGAGPPRRAGGTRLGRAAQPGRAGGRARARAGARPRGADRLPGGRAAGAGGSSRTRGRRTSRPPSSAPASSTPSSGC